MKTSQHHTSGSNLWNAESGASLLEMLISLTIGLIIIAGIGFSYLASKQSFREQDVLSRMQEGARIAFEILDKDIRMAGYQGCMVNSGDINVLTAASDWDKNLVGSTGLPLIGYENTNETSIAFPATAYSGFPTLPSGANVTGVTGNVWQGDAITILHADPTQEYIVKTDNTSASQMTLNTNHNLLQGQIMVVTDCLQTAEFQKTNTCTLTNGSCGNAIVQYGSSSTTTTTQLGSPAGTAYPFSAGSKLYPLSAVTYYISKDTSTGNPALYRQRLTTASGSPTNIQEELVEGVQDMQISYALDTTGDGAVDSYAIASNITATQWAVSTTPVVLGVRISLLMVSRADEQGITSQPLTYAIDFNGDGNTTDAGESVTPTDSLLRKVFSTTISVKNRL
jgi:type IV pilus assembly protein PilW